MNRGHSLVELLVYVALLAVCLVIAFPVAADMEKRYTARSACATLSSDLLTARYHAVADGVSYRLRFESPHSYCIEKRTAGGWEERRRREFDRSVVLESSNSPLFTPSGAVTNMSTTKISVGGRLYRRVSIAMTGRVRVEDVP